MSSPAGITLEDLITAVIKIEKLQETGQEDIGISEREELADQLPAIIVRFVRCLKKEKLPWKRHVMSNLSTCHMNLTIDKPIFKN
ncbi:hypothetical protein J6590_081883 [Homalodisca vitripennis]|nr:hypothetical protein J6590_081883 [Homalodisca vitripennis]